MGISSGTAIQIQNATYERLHCYEIYISQIDCVTLSKSTRKAQSYVIFLYIQDFSIYFRDGDILFLIFLEYVYRITFSGIQVLLCFAFLTQPNMWHINTYSREIHSWLPPRNDRIIYHHSRNCTQSWTKTVWYCTEDYKQTSILYQTSVRLIFPLSCFKLNSFCSLHYRLSCLMQTSAQ
jgi:hypothetical protein